MAKLWQLKKLSSGETLNEPQPLPENWGPIFGLAGIQDQLGDLSWLGENFADQGWFQVGDGPDAPATSTPAELAWGRAKQLLAESDWAMLPDVPMLAGEKTAWMAYRRSLREIRLQSGFPDVIAWPSHPA
jgi:hypothetical protein